VEGCLSLRAADGSLRYWLVERPKRVRVRGLKLRPHPETFRLEFADIDFVEDHRVYSVVYAHEIDHQNGVLISDIGQEIELRK
jgi:peptide deformylase